MKKISFAIYVLLFTSTNILAQSFPLTESRVRWAAYAVGNFSSESGMINNVSGSLQASGNKLTGKLVFDTRSFTVTSRAGRSKEKMEKILKEDGFLEVKKYPTASMDILSATPLDLTTNLYKLTARISGKNQVKTTSFPATVTMQQGYIRIKTLPLKVNRKDYNLLLKSSFHEAMVKDYFDISFDLIFRRQ